MEQMIALWSMVMVHALIVVGPVIVPFKARSWGPETNEAREHLAIGNQM